MKKLLLLFLPMLFFACQSDEFRQVSYFKSDQNFRVFVYAVPNESSLEVIQKHAKERMYTEGSTTAVYYYTVSTLDSLKYDITTANDAFQAQDLACTKGCIAGYWKFPTGKESFIENPCVETE
jgi:hypothetical protein